MAKTSLSKKIKSTTKTSKKPASPSPDTALLAKAVKAHTKQLEELRDEQARLVEAVKDVREALRNQALNYELSQTDAKALANQIEALLNHLAPDRGTPRVRGSSDIAGSMRRMEEERPEGIDANARAVIGRQRRTAR